MKIKNKKYKKFEIDKDYEADEATDSIDDSFDHLLLLLNKSLFLI